MNTRAARGIPLFFKLNGARDQLVAPPRVSDSWKRCWYGKYLFSLFWCSFFFLVFFFFNNKQKSWNMSKMMFSRWNSNFPIEEKFVVIERKKNKMNFAIFCFHSKIGIAGFLNITELYYVRLEHWALIEVKKRKRKETKKAECWGPLGSGAKGQKSLWTPSGQPTIFFLPLSIFWSRNHSTSFSFSRTVPINLQGPESMGVFSF